VTDGGGILVADRSTIMLVNTIINNNSVLDVLPGYGTGGGIAIYSSTATLMNCTVRKNSTTKRKTFCGAPWRWSRAMRGCAWGFRVSR